MSGEVFKGLFPILSTQLFKLTNEEEIHNGFQFKDGLNIDTVSFNPQGECQPGGIYFTDIDNLPTWTNYKNTDMKYARKVLLLDESVIYIEKGKYKANEIFLEERIDLADLPCWSDEEFCIKAASMSDLSVKYIKNPTDKIKIIALDEYPFLINDILDSPTISEDLQLNIIDIDGYFLKNLLMKGVHVSEKVQLAAVRKTGYAIEYLLENYVDVSEDVQLASVRNSRQSLEFLLKHGIKVSEKVQIEAVSLYDDALKQLLDHNIDVSEKVSAALYIKNCNQ